MRYKVDLADTTLARDAAADVKHGNFGGSSIGFRAAADGIEKRQDGDTTIRVITDVAMLRDVGPVTDPAFSGTSVSARCRQELEKSFLQERRGRLAEERSRRMEELAKQIEVT